MKTSAIQNVVFDLGGVLITWKPDEIISRVFDQPDVQALIRREVFQHPDWLEMDKGYLEEADAIRRFHERTGLPSSKFEELLKCVQESLMPIPESVELLDDLASRGFNLYCLSNMPLPRFKYIRRLYPFWSHFKGIIISGEVRMVKPDREIFDYLLSSFALEPSSTLFIDDHSVNVSAASNLGLHTILFSNAIECRQQLDLDSRMDHRDST